MSDRRSFLKKLGIGSILFTAGGVFTIKDEEIESAKIEVEQVSDDQILMIANSILDALDGKATNPLIYDAITKRLKKGTIYEYSDRPEIEL